MSNKTNGAPKTAETTATLVPRLRFPEFQDAGEWEQKTIGSVCSSFSGGTPNTSIPEYYGGEIPFIRSAEIARDRTELFLTRDGLLNSAAKPVSKGDVLIALYGANSGDVALAKLDGAINQAILCLKSQGSNAFIYHFMTFKKDWVVATYLQGGQGNLSGEIVKSILAGFPTLAEQQRIADCLSSLDALIAAQARKVDALKSHKKGLMQQLFPCDGETQPRLRFPEFQDAGEWEVKTLGSVVKITSEKVGDKKCVPMSITSGVGLVSQMEKFGRIIAGNSYTNYIQLNKNDFAYNKSATKEYPEGFIALYTGNELAAVPNSIFTCFRVISISTLPEYLNYLFLGNLHGKWLRKFIEVGARAHGSLSINDADLLALRIPLPPTLAEQQRIADCLSSLDDLIAAATRQLATLKTHKQGLMQQLFPNVEEIES